jgi:hypothetical protein
MVPGDLLLICTHEATVPDDLLAADVEPVDPVRSGKDKPRDQVPGPCHFQRVSSPHRDVCPLARLERAEIVPSENGSAAFRTEPQSVARRHRRGAAADARDEQRLLDLEEQVAALVRR